VACDVLWREWLPVVFLLQFKKEVVSPRQKKSTIPTIPNLFYSNFKHFKTQREILEIGRFQESLRNPEIKNKRKMKGHNEKFDEYS
jgi:hypothetical protein